MYADTTDQSVVGCHTHRQVRRRLSRMQRPQTGSSMAALCTEAYFCDYHGEATARSVADCHGCSGHRAVRRWLRNPQTGPSLAIVSTRLRAHGQLGGRIQIPHPDLSLNISYGGDRLVRRWLSTRLPQVTDQSVAGCHEAATGDRPVRRSQTPFQR
jgi:hypothetical protein